MKCLYCNKKLGLFASRKRPFCGEQHEVAYTDEQAGLAMRRVMDPLFTEPIKKAPLQVSNRPAQVEPPLKPRFDEDPSVRAAAPPAMPPDAPLSPDPEPEAGAGSFLGIVVPPPSELFFPEMPFVPVSLDAVAPESLIGFDLPTPDAQLPVWTRGLMDEGDLEIPAGRGALRTEHRFPHRLHPILDQSKPEPSEDESASVLEGVASPVTFGTGVTRRLPGSLAIHADAMDAPSGKVESRLAIDDQPAVEEVARRLGFEKAIAGNLPSAPPIGPEAKVAPAAAVESPVILEAAP